MIRKTLAKKGFTLIELMIVVAIIGILAAVAIPKFADLVTKSKEASVKGNLGAVRSAVSIYYSDTEGVFPSNLFVALTTNNKYMPSVGGVTSLGRIEIPAHTNNVGHNFTTVVAADVDQVTDFSTITDGNAFIYIVMGATQQGDLAISCSHKDTKNSQWTSY